jgi:hypothetical protein
MLPVREMARVTPACAPVITADPRACPPPVTMEITTLKVTRPVHIQLSTIDVSPPGEQYEQNVLLLQYIFDIFRIFLKKYLTQVVSDIIMINKLSRCKRNNKQ